MQQQFPQSDALNQRPAWQNRLRNYFLLIRADRPIGTYLLLWPTLWALWVAGAGQPVWWIVCIFVAGTFLMRSAGCAINDYADRNLDGHVARTAQRPLATGAISPKEALGVFVVLSLVAFGLVLFLNWQTILHSFVAVSLAAIYPFSKRFTHLPQFILGLAFAWSVPMAFTALQGETQLVTWYLFAATVLWTIAYDTMYAMVDRDDDLKIGIKSTAILFAQYDRLIIGLLQLAVLGLLWQVGLLTERSVVYWVSLGVGAGLFVFQQYLIRNRERDACFQAFLNNNVFGLAVFVGLFVDYLV